MGFQHIVFDLDGTLSDPKIGIFNCIDYALRKMGREAKGRDHWERFIGPPLLQSFAKLLKTDDPELAQQALTYYRERFGQQGLFENRLYPGIPALLGELHKRGCTLYVATSKPRVFARRIIAHFQLDRFFKEVHGSGLDGTRAEKAELIGHVLQVENLEPAVTVMIGDRKYDIAGAKACGLKAVGVLWGYGPLAELQSAGADWLCARPPELAALCSPGK